MSEWRRLGRRLIVRLRSGTSRRRNIDLVEHLDNSAVLVEINILFGVRMVQLLYTDQHRRSRQVLLTPTQAALMGVIIRKFDRRGVREIALAMIQGAQELHEGEDTWTS